MSSNQMSSNLKDITAVILAGGYGTRIQHLLQGIPKPMAPVVDKPFVEWVVRYWGTQGITSTILSTGYLSELVEQHFQNQPVNGVETICRQETSPLGTAGGFLNAVSQVTRNPWAWLVLNGDSLVFSKLTLLTAHLLDSKISGVIVGLPVADASRYGSLVCDEKNNLLGFEEKRPGKGLISAGVYLLRHTLINEFPRGSPLSFENEVFPALLAQGLQLKVQIVQDPFLDIGTPESFPQTEAFIVENLRRFMN